MKISYLKIIALFMFISFGAFAQKPVANQARVIIDTRGIDFHTLKELELMQKGVLMDLYVDRVKVLINVLPYIGIADKPGVTLKDIGIIETEQVIKDYDNEKNGRGNFVAANATYIKQMLQFGEKANIIKAILFYENFLTKLKGGTEE